MSERPPATPTPHAHTEYHPRWHRTRVSTWWWLRRWAYLKFILRELSSVAVAYSVAVTLLWIHALSAGPDAYAAFHARMRAPWVVAVTAASFAFAVLHSVTWFNLAPRAAVVRVRGRRVPDAVVAGANYAAWIAVSAAVAWLVLGGR